MSSEIHQIEPLDSTNDVEIWKDVPGWEDRYEASTWGNVRSKDWVVTTRRLIKGKYQEFSWISKGKLLTKNSIEGYPTVSFTRNGVSENVLVHIIVAKTFLPNPNNYPVVNHKDTNRSNNHVENLEWCTYEYNNIHAVYHDCSKQAIAVICKETGRWYPSVTRAEIDLGIPKGSCRRIENKDYHYVYKNYHFIKVCE